MTKNEGMLKGLVIGLLAGGAVGAIVALLYAPKSGRELRADLKERADEFRDDADEYLTAMRTKAGELVSEAKKRSDSLITDAKRKADTLLVDAEKVLTDARQKSGTIAEEGPKGTPSRPAWMRSRKSVAARKRPRSRTRRRVWNSCLSLLRLSRSSVSQRSAST
jgi:gas vesicle protein